MSWRSEGESEENQRPAFTASRSSIVSIGSSIVCLVGDLRVKNCRQRDQQLEGKVLRLVVWRVFVQKRGNADASIGMMQIVDEMLFFQCHVGKQTVVGRSIDQLFDAAKRIGCTFIQALVSSES